MSIIVNDAIFIDKDTKSVGIGSTLPRQLLDVLGGNLIVFGGSIGIGTTLPRQLLDVEGGNAIVSGNVGIGTTLARQKLDVQGGNAIVSGNVGIGTTLARQKLDVQGGNAIVSGNLGIGTTVAREKLDIQDGNAIVSGNVGIGTTQARQKLDVEGGNAIVSGNVGIGTTLARQKLDIQGGNAIVSGNLGIGTSNPQANLHIIGVMIYQGRLMPMLDGSTSQNAAPNAKYIQETFNITADGVYWINLPSVGATQVYCIMNPICAGGGWMMCLKGTRGTTFNYNANYWTTNNTLNPTATNRNDGDAKFQTYNNFPATNWLAIFPDVTSGGDIPNGYGGWTWIENNAVNTRISLLEFFTRNYQITKASNGVGYPITNPQPLELLKFSSSLFSTESGFIWYGINYKTLAASSVRWGFNFNNEADQLSNDTRAGIGLVYNNYSAGDGYGCCGVTLGVQRSMRFEWYVQ